MNDFEIELIKELEPLKREQEQEQREADDLLKLPSAAEEIEQVFLNGQLLVNGKDYQVGLHGIILDLNSVAPYTDNDELICVQKDGRVLNKKTNDFVVHYNF